MLLTEQQVAQRLGELFSGLTPDSQKRRVRKLIRAANIKPHIVRKDTVTVWCISEKQIERIAECPLSVSKEKTKRQDKSQKTGMSGGLSRAERFLKAQEQRNERLQKSTVSAAKLN